MKALFIHDHVFLKYNDRFYSNGKLTYDVLNYYLMFCENLTVIGRYKNVDFDPGIEFISEGINVKVLGYLSPVSLKGLLSYKDIKSSLNKLIDESDFVIIRQPSELGLLSSKLSRKLNKPSLTEMVASPFDCLWFRGDIAAKLYAPLLHLRVKHSIKFSNYVIYVTSCYLQTKYPTLGQHISISDARVNSSNSAALSIDDKSKIVIGVIANPALSLKGIGSLFKALIRLDKTRFELQIVGGSLNSDIESSMKLHSNIKQLGFIADKKDLFDWLSKINLYIQPSFTEGLPRSIIEAMSFGIPVIGSKVGGIPEVVHEECLFKAGNVNQIVDVINRLSSNPSFYEEISLHSTLISHKFNENLDLEKMEFFNQFKLDNF